MPWLTHPEISYCCWGDYSTLMFLSVPENVSQGQTMWYIFGPNLLSLKLHYRYEEWYFWSMWEPTSAQEDCNGVGRSGSLSPACCAPKLNWASIGFKKYVHYGCSVVARKLIWDSIFKPQNQTIQHVNNSLVVYSSPMLYSGFYPCWPTTSIYSISVCHISFATLSA